jgi:hypothetical protein
MIQTKPIIADPLRLYELGVRNLMDMAILIHIGRCGIIGARRRSIADHISVSYDTARTGTDRLWDLGLITSASRDHGPGLAHNLVCTVRGWNLLTQPADFTMFPHSQLALKNHATRKKSRKETPSENQTPADDAPGIDVGGGGDDNHPADTAKEPVTERADALDDKTEGDQGSAGTGEADNSERAERP